MKTKIRTFRRYKPKSTIMGVKELDIVLKYFYDNKNKLIQPYQINHLIGITSTETDDARRLLNKLCNDGYIDETTRGVHLSHHGFVLNF